MLTGQALQAGTVAAESEHPVRNMTPRSCVSVNPGEGYAGERGDARSGRRSCDERDRVRRVQSVWRWSACTFALLFSLCDLSVCRFQIEPVRLRLNSTS